jgi:hypothetical protein
VKYPAAIVRLLKLKGKACDNRLSAVNDYLFTLCQRTTGVAREDRRPDSYRVEQMKIERLQVFADWQDLVVLRWCLCCAIRVPFEVLVCYLYGASFVLLRCFLKKVQCFYLLSC